jgi:hypothetical protein
MEKLDLVLIRMNELMNELKNEWKIKCEVVLTKEGVPKWNFLKD